MELYKLRYNLYNYIFDSNIDYKLFVVSKNILKYFLIAFFVIFIIITISDTSKISYIIFFFILFGIILIYLTFLIDNSFDIIKTDKKFIGYCIYFRLFNCIFIDSYKYNDIPLYIKNDEYPDITKKTLTNIIDDYISTSTSTPSNKNNYYNTSSLIIFQTTNKKKEIYNDIKKNINAELEEINIVKYNNSQYYIYIKYLKNRDESSELNNKICEYVNEYYNVHNDVIELLDIVINARIDYKYLYSIDLNELELKKDKSSILNELYNLLKKYFVKRFSYNSDLFITRVGTDKFQNILINTSDNNYLNTFYNTLMEINTNIKYNDNIGKDDIYTYSEDLIKSNSILKFINVNNDNKYKLLKKWIFIKIDNDNDFHKEIKNNYESNKDKYISEINSNGIRVSNVIIDISSVYNSTITLKYFLIDIETINNFLRKKNQENDNYNMSINQYILNIYKTLLDNYNYRIDLNNPIENFDILFDVNKDIDKEINILINNFLYYYNLIIVIVIIIMTIILHIFYIELFRFI